ncbi:class I SAM-dependent methyltransferase [Ichthyenterobacterium magnum]|uniref:Methyltransferase family protein n=1 Tax=Ichthyenterobacterium magnum TaxID=1230530 RepID=A0A420DUK6_9FLAO|nr:class I SAM-dependent methyltransferase [Ichthyenterobacterium magnum]RKE97991.1 methyltransferase family protein [Ichthyenterobacterium magnum]
MYLIKKIIKKVLPKSLLYSYYKYNSYKKNNAHVGTGVECTICKSQFKYFQAYGLVKRQNARCFTCGSLERHRLLWTYFEEELDFLRKGTKIKMLHFAPEKMFYNHFDNMQNVAYIPCDLNPEEYNYAGNTKTMKVDITKIPFKDETFDFIICSHVLEHIPDDKLAMSELFRVMKKGGTGIFQVPIDYNNEDTYEDFSITTPEGREKAFGQNDHVRLYGRDYKDRLNAVGFKVKEDDYVLKFSKKELKMYGFIPSELIYNCTK